MKVKRKVVTFGVMPVIITVLAVLISVRIFKTSQIGLITVSRAERIEDKDLIEVIY